LESGSAFCDLACRASMEWASAFPRAWQNKFSASESGSAFCDLACHASMEWASAYAIYPEWALGSGFAEEEAAAEAYSDNLAAVAVEG
jgi:hypothetical protein